MVVIGYGAVKKSDLTGSVSNVKMSDIRDVPNTSVDQALQGRIAGVDIMSTSGAPGATTSIRVRGTRSISASNEPLIVVDGIIDAVQDLSDINSADIESISVSKDATANSLYGSRAANGVVFITTKRGSLDNPTISVDTRFGINTRAVPEYDIITDPGEYLEAQWRTMRDTKWASSPEEGGGDLAAAALYASQGDKTPVLEIGSSMDIGDYPAGNIGDIWAFTNAEEVALYKNDRFVASFRTKGWDGLPHGPVAIDDTIGELLETQEHFPHDKAELLRKCLVSAGKNGLAGMPVADKARMAWAMARYKLTMDDGVALFGKYVGNWGGAATRWRFDAKNGDTVVKSVTLCPSHRLHLEVTPSATVLQEGDTYDMAGVRVRILDENGSPGVYAQLPLTFAVTGAAVLVGPAAGMGGTYLRTVGQTGRAALTVSAPQCAPVTVEFTVTKKECAVWN